MSYGAYDYGYLELLDLCGFGNFTQDEYVEETTQAVIDKLAFLSDEYGAQDSELWAS
jgi:hypothetical protein